METLLGVAASGRCLQLAGSLVIVAVGGAGGGGGGEESMWTSSVGLEFI